MSPRFICQSVTRPNYTIVLRAESLDSPNYPTLFAVVVAKLLVFRIVAAKRLRLLAVCLRASNIPSAAPIPTYGQHLRNIGRGSAV